MKTKLLLMLFVAAVLSASAGANEVAIVNPGFEDPVLEDGDSTLYGETTAWIEGWYELGAADPNEWWGYPWGAGAINPDAGYGYGGIAPEGQNIAFVTPYPGYDQGLSQILSDTLQEGMIYELSALVGNPAVYNGGEPISDYRIELVAGNVVVAMDTGPSPAPNAWTTANLTFSPGADHPQIGKPLEIRLIMVDFSADYELNFDDVRLDAISDPMKPSPYDGEYVYVGDVELSWTNMDPNEGVTDVYVDVYFGLDPTKPTKPGNWDLIVDATDPLVNPNATTATGSAPDDQTTYYWQVNSYIYGSPTGDPIEGLIYKVHATTDKPPSAEIVTADMITWSGEAVQLDATVDDDELSGPLTIEWSASPDDGVVFSDPSAEDPIVTITNDFTDFPVGNPGFETGLSPWTGNGGTWGGGSDLTPSEGVSCVYVWSDGDPVGGDPDPYDGGISQILAETLTADTTYTLTVDVANDGYYYEDVVHYRVQLLAGGVVLDQDDDGHTLDTVGVWETSTVVHSSGSAPAQLGEPLEIRLIAKAGTLEMSFDNVKLSADTFYYTDGIPTPIKLTLFVDDHFEFNPPLEETMMIDVYDDACYAAIGAGVVNPSDINVNCITGLEDLAEMLLTWTDDNALTAPIVKEGSRLAAVASASAEMELVGYWPFDEGTGDVAYDYMELNNAAMTNHTWVLPGKLGAAAISTTEATVVDAGPGPTPTNQDLTLVWWMIDNHDSYGTLMNKSADQSTSGYNILVRPDNEDYPLIFRIGGWQKYGDWGAECCLPDGAYNDGEWVHIACTYDSATDTATIYVNGELAPNGSLNPKVGGIAGDDGYCDGVNNADEPLYIVGSAVTGEGFTGLIDEVAIWDTALTPDQVRSVYESGVGSLTRGAKDPSPEDGGYVHPATDVELSWTNMDPNKPGDSVYVDVWFGTEPNELNPAYDMDLVVDATTPAGENTTSVTVDASTLGETYYWQVNSYIYGSSHINEPNMVEGRLWRFHTVTDVPVSEDAGSDVLAWSGQTVQLDGTVEDYGEGDVEMIAWSADPADGVVFSDPSVEDPTVTITKATDNPSIVTLTLSAQDGIGSDEDTMEIVVYDTACLAAIGDGEEFDPADFDLDCATDLEDYAVIAEEWLVNSELTEPVEKP